MVNYFDEGAPEFEIAESMSDEYYRIKARFEIFCRNTGRGRVCNILYITYDMLLHCMMGT